MQAKSAPATGTATTAPKKALTNDEVAKTFEDALTDSNAYFEDYIAYLREHGHENFANALEEFAEQQKNIADKDLMVAVSTLALKHQLSLFLINKIRKVLTKFKGKDHIWKNAIARRRPTHTHPLVYVEFNDNQGHHHGAVVRL